jgi:hypothetical protein
MMAKAVATRETVFAAADKLLEENEDPSILAVRKVCGGSNSTIQVFLKEWHEVRSKQALKVAAFPVELVARGQSLLSDFWESASRIANAEIESIRERSTKEVSLAEQRLNEALQEIDCLQASIEEKNILIEGRTNDCREFELKIAGLESTVKNMTELESRLLQMQAELSAAQQEAAYSKGKAEYANSLIYELKQNSSI